MNQENQIHGSYEITIQPNRSWFHIDWKGVVHHRDLLFIFVMRDFVAKYKQTILGPLWFILSPLLTTLVFTVIFGKVTKIPTDGLPPILFYLCGLLTWNYFAACLNSTSNSLLSQMNLYSKVYFPRIIVPLSTVFSNLLTFVLQIVFFLGIYFYFRNLPHVGDSIHPNYYLFLLPLLLFQTAVAGLGVGLWISALTVKYRDLHYLMGFLIQLWMYATPIIYPSSLIPEKWRFLTVLNPMAGIVETYRYAFFGVGFVRPSYLFVSAVITFIVFLTGLFLFNKAERTFVDWI